MMQGHFAVLPSKYDIYYIPNIISTHNISLNSQRKMLNYNTGSEGYCSWKDGK